MAFKPVKNRGGFSPSARRHATQLDAIGVDFLHRRNGDGSTSRKSGGRLYAEPSLGELPDFDGFYSLGDVGGKYRIVASSDARGRFVDRGDAGSEAFNFPALGFFGKGKGAVSKLTTLGTVPNFDGRACYQFNLDLFTTRNGKSLTPYSSAFACAPHNEYMLTNYHGGRVLEVEGEPVFQFATSFMNVMTGGEFAGQHSPIYMIHTKDGATIGDIIVKENQIQAAPRVAHLGPSRRVMMCITLWPTYSPTIAPTSATPGLYFQDSLDGGRHWNLTSALDSVFGDGLDQLKAACGAWTPAKAVVWNKAVQGARLTTYQPQPNTDVFVAVCPYAANVSGTLTAMGRVKLGKRDPMTGQFVVASTLYDGTIEQAVTFAGSGGIEFYRDGAAGVLLFVRPVTGTEWGEPRAVIWTDGESHSYIGAMPMANQFTGIVTAAARRELLCPMFDGQFSLYGSTDGLQWSRRATISPVGTPPNAADHDLALQNFGQITLLRNDNFPAILTPSAPWASDYRRSND